MIKVTTQTSKNKQYITVSWDTLQYKRKSKNFSAESHRAAWDFVCGLPEIYVGSSDSESLNWAMNHDHRVIRCKNFCFA